jgi:hypothetical protein
MASKPRYVDQLETFPSRRIGEMVVERNDLERRRTAFGGKDSRCKLERSTASLPVRQVLLMVEASHPPPRGPS